MACPWRETLVHCTIRPIGSRSRVLQVDSRQWITLPRCREFQVKHIESLNQNAVSHSLKPSIVLALPVYVQCNARLWREWIAWCRKGSKEVPTGYSLWSDRRGKPIFLTEHGNQSAALAIVSASAVWPIHMFQSDLWLNHVCEGTQKRGDRLSWVHRFFHRSFQPSIFYLTYTFRALVWCFPCTFVWL